MATYWACAQTHPRQEELALRNLRRQQFVSFFPFFMIRKLKHGIPQGEYLAKPAFPGYVFIELDEDRHWSPINSTLGISRLMTHQGSDEYRSPCRADFVEDLRRVSVLPADKPLRPDLIPIGTWVKITRGPFSERTALVSLSSERRIAVMLEVFNRETVLEFDVDAVMRIARPVA